MKIVRGLGVIAAIGAVTCPAFAQDEQSMSAEEMAKVQEVFAKYASPGPEHQAFEPLVGTFEYTSSFWMAPGTDPMVDAGTAEYSWEYGGRFLKQKVTGTAMGQPFAGTGIMGFDRYRNEHFSFWYDNMTTNVMLAKGHADASGKIITYEGTHDNIWEDKKDEWTKSVLAIEDDAHTLSMFVKGPDGKEFKNFEIVYTRAKMASK